MEMNLSGELSADISASVATIKVRHFDTKTGAAREPLSTSLFFTINKDTADSENVLAGAHTTTSGITTYTTCVRGVSDSAISVGAGTGVAHSEGAPCGHVTAHLPVSILANILNGTNATGSAELKIGDATSGDSTITFENDQTVAPSIYLDDSNESQIKGHLGDDAGAAGDFSIGQQILTTAERDALTSPLNGMTILNSTTGVMNFREGGAWVANASGTSLTDASLTAGGKVALLTEAEGKAGTDTEPTSSSPGVLQPSNIAANVQKQGWSFFADAEANDTYVITPTPAIAAYATGQRFSFTANTANTGAATLNVNAKGAKDILKHNDQALITGDIEASQVVEVVYDGTSMQMVSQKGQSPSTLLSAKGSVVAASAANTPAELAIGSNQTMLTADSNETTGVRWGELQDIWVSAERWSENEAGAGTLTFGNSYSTTYVTAATSGNYGSINTQFATPVLGGTSAQPQWGFFTDGDIIEVSAALRTLSTTAVDFMFGFSSAATSVNTLTETTRKAYFKATNGTLESSTSDGSTEEDQSVTGITLTNYNKYTIRIDLGNSVKFYVNDVLKTTHTTNVPDAATTGIPILSYGVKTTENATKQIRVLQPMKLRRPRVI